MEDVLDIRPPAGKIYSDASGAITGFLGGPLAAAYVIGHNYLLFGKRRAAVLTWVIAVAAFCFAIGTGFIPVLDKIPNLAFPIAFSFIARQVIKTGQAGDVAVHLEHGGRIYSPWRGALISVLFAAILIALMIGIGYAIDGQLPF